MFRFLAASSLVFSISILAHADPCNDLTGKWAGKCTQNDGTTFDYSVELQQLGCDKIMDLGEAYVEHVGEPETFSITLNGRRFIHMAQLSWSADGKILQWTASNLGYDPTTNKIAIEVGNGTETVENDVYHLKSDYSTRRRAGDVQSKADATYDCALNRTTSLHSAAKVARPGRTRLIRAKNSNNIF